MSMQDPTWTAWQDGTDYITAALRARGAEARLRECYRTHIARELRGPYDGVGYQVSVDGREVVRVEMEPAAWELVMSMMDDGAELRRRRQEQESS
jgi:hypothetical protein